MEKIFRHFYSGGSVFYFSFAFPQQTGAVYFAGNSIKSLIEHKLHTHQMPKQRQNYQKEKEAV